MKLGSENLAVVEERMLETGPEISGVLRARKEATVRAEIGGALLEITAEQGRRARRGELLARIDDSAIHDQVLAARAAARSAENVLALARRNAERAHLMAKGGAIAPRDLEQAETQLAAAQAQKADADARVAAAEQQMSRTRLRAPFDGVVSERPASAGDIVQAGTALFTVVDPATMRLEASVPAEQLASLKVGTPVDFAVTGYEGRAFRGAVEQINPTVDPTTRQVRIYVTIPNAGGQLLVGLFARGRVATEARQVLAAPVDVVDLATATPTVLRVRDGKAERVPVELGLRDEVAEMVALRSGVAPGDVLVRGSARGQVGPGTSVQITDSVPQRTDRGPQQVLDPPQAPPSAARR